MTPLTLPFQRSVRDDLSMENTVLQWTTGPHKNQHLYFTSHSVTADDRWLAIISDREGDPNLYAIDRRNGAIRRLSDNRHGLLHSYVYPGGGARGLSKASPALDPWRNEIYYVRDDAVFGVALDSPSATERRVAALPQHWWTAYTHISPNGNTLCVPCTEPRAFVDTADSQWDQLRSVPMRMKQGGLVSRIMLIDLRTGAAKVAAELPFWVTHVQFDPAGTGRILFNQEGFLPGTGRQIPDRIWCLEPGGAVRPLAPEMPGEWRSHENWTPAGDAIMYHGGRDGALFIAKRAWDGRLLCELSLESLACYHATPALDGRHLFIDGHDGFISCVDPESSPARMTHLCRHDTSMNDQDTHAHPLTTPNGASVIFTSDATGTCNVYEVILPPELHPGRSDRDSD